MNILNSIIFYTIAILLIVMSILTVFSKRIIHSVFFALVCFILTGFLFFALNAPFIGVVQISIYGIALSILFTIAVNLTDYKNEIFQKIKITPKFFLTVSGLLMIIFSATAAIIQTAKYDSSFFEYLFSKHLLTSFDSSIQLSSELLYHNYFAFEILGIYLLAALIGIAVLFAFKGEQ